MEGYHGTVGFCLEGPRGIGKWECQLYGDGGSQKVWVQRRGAGRWVVVVVVGTP